MTALFSTLQVAMMMLGATMAYTMFTGFSSMIGSFTHRGGASSTSVSASRTRQ